jgi:hypothetical protein
MPTISGNVTDPKFVDPATEVDQRAVKAVRKWLVEELPFAAGIYARIESDNEALEALREASYKKSERLREKKTDAIAVLGRFDRDTMQYGTNAERDAERIALVQELEDFNVAIAAENEARKKLVNPYPLSTLEKWATAVFRKTNSMSFKAIHPKMRKGGDLVALLEQNREARAEFLKERRRVDGAALPYEQAKAAAVAQIEKIAREGEPKVRGLYRLEEGIGNRRRQGSIKFREKFVGLDKPEEVEIFPTFVWLNKSGLIEAIDWLLQEQRPDFTLTVEERPARLAEIDKELHELELEESALIAAIHKAGKAKAEYRSSMAPEVVLLLEPVATEPKSATKPKRAREGVGWQQLTGN